MDPTDLLLFAQTSGVMLHYDRGPWHARLGPDSATGPTPTRAVETLQQLITDTAPPPTAEWMRSLHHDWAHLIEPNGVALCSARIPMGSMWHPAEETRRCKRCQGQAKLRGMTGWEEVEGE